jgi:hypothetical protein
MRMAESGVFAQLDEQRLLLEIWYGFLWPTGAGGIAVVDFS